MKTYNKLFINLKTEEWKKKTISYNQAVKLAFPEYKGQELFTVQYSRGVGNAQGTLIKGQHVPVKDGMIFDISITGNS
jgi:hypothetical protein